MQVQRHANAREFLAQSQSWLLESEPENNLILDIARRYEDQSASSGYFWATIISQGKIVGAAFRTPPHFLGVSNMLPAAAGLLVNEVASVYPDLPGVAGPIDVAEGIAQRWTTLFGGSWRVKLRQRIHALTSLEDISPTPSGALRQMRHSDSHLILEWMNGFVRETGAMGPAERVARPMLDQRKFHLWEDNGPRCVVAAARDTPNGSCVNAVFTPPEFRGKGYATAAVSELTRMLLESGKAFCCLYTDLANPTSNAIYYRIDYRPVRDDAEVVIEKS